MTHTLQAAGAVLAYDVRTGTGPVLLMIGSPMEAAGFASLAARFPDRTVVTYDPRGTGRSRRTDGAAETTPDEHADDLHRLIAALGDEPVDVFASSGGAVNALVLAARHPGQIRTLVAHEPPALQVLPDREQALAAAVAIRRVYEQEGFGAAMARFIMLVGWRGPVPDDLADRPGPDPAQFGLPVGDDGDRGDPLLAGILIPTTHYRHDFAALRAGGARIVPGVGVESEGQPAYRAGRAVADRLGVPAVVFPGDHAGFLGGEFGMTGDPDGFAATLRRVLDGTDDGDGDENDGGRGNRHHGDRGSSGAGAVTKP